VDSSGPNDAQVQLYSPGCANVPSLNHLSTAAIRALLPAALRAAHRDGYLIYSEADFEVFRPTTATRCTDEGEIWRGGPKIPSYAPNFTPIGATKRV